MNLFQLILKIQTELESLNAENRALQQVMDLQATDLRNQATELSSLQKELKEMKRSQSKRMTHDDSDAELSNQRSLQFGQYVTRPEFRYYRKSLNRLSKRLRCISSESNGGDLIIEGCNLHVQNGLGRSSATNGKGNLIIGYNELEDSGVVPERRGSHNVIVGPQHQYTSVGSIISGKSHTVTGMYSSSIGGTSSCGGEFLGVEFGVGC